MPKPAPVAAADCERLKALVVAVTADDVKHEEEIPAVDTPSCTLTVTCRPDTAPKISVQRQSASGSGHVAQLIDALERLP